MSVASRNSQDAISMMQTAEASMDEMTNMAYRMNDLATQAANGTNSAEDIAALQSEYDALASQLGDMQTSTNFGGQQLLGSAGSFGSGAVTFQIGSTSADTLDVDVSSEVSGLETSVTTLASGSFATDAGAVMDNLETFIADLGSARSAFGAQINNLEHNINNLANMTENLEASKGRIMDTDFASESGNMSKNQMLMQSGAQMLSATKTIPQLAMSMLG